MQSSTQILLAGALLGLGCQLATAERPSDAAPTERVHEEVWSRLCADPEPVRGQVVGALADLGPEALPVYLELLAGGAPPPAVPEGEAPPRLPRGWDAIVMEACGRISAEEVLGYVEALEAPGVDQGLAAARVLAHREDTDVLPTLLRLCERIDPAVLCAPAVQRSFRRAVAAPLDRRLRSGGRILSARESWSPGVQALVVRALGDIGGPRALEAIRAVVGRDDDLDVVVLDVLGEARLLDRTLLGDQIRETVRGALLHFEPQCRRRAALAAARLGDGRACGPLVEVLEDDDPTVVRSALEALRRISGQPWGADPRRWRRWYEAEELWVESEAPRLAEDLACGESLVALDALRAFREHPLFAHTTAPWVVAGTMRAEPDLVRIAHDLLRRQGSLTAVEELVVTMDHWPTAEDELAAETLRHLTRKDLPAERSAWQAWLDEAPTAER